MQNSHSVLLKVLMDQLLERLCMSKNYLKNASSYNPGFTSLRRVPLTSSQTCNIGMFQDQLHILEHLQHYVMTRMSEDDVCNRINKVRKNSLFNTKTGQKRKAVSCELDSVSHRFSKKSRNAALPQSSAIRRTFRI